MVSTKKVVALVCVCTISFMVPSGFTEVEFNDDLEEQLADEPLIQELIEIRNQFTERLLKKHTGPEGVNIQEALVELENLKEDFQRGEHESVLASLGISDQEALGLDLRLQEITEELFEKYPALADAADQFEPCTDCSENAENAFNLIKQHMLLVAESEDAAEGASRCKWVQFTLSVALCASTGYIIFWPCSYLAYCAFCEGPIPERICW